MASRSLGGMDSKKQYPSMIEAKRKKILVAIDWYLPGFNGGGPITSIANLVKAFEEVYDFDIITSNRDYGQKDPYPNIETDTWIRQTENSRVWYCASDTQSYRHFRRLVQDIDYDLLYLNSMFSLRYTIFPLWNSRAAKPQTPVLLAPRGMLHAGALSLKPLKKKIFLKALNLSGVYKQVHFQATDDQEVEDIRTVFGEKASIFQASNLPSYYQPALKPIEKEEGKLNLIFMSRISEKKGLHLLLETLIDQKAEIQLQIIGPDKEAGYWERCEKIIARLPENIKVQKMSPMPAKEAFAHLQASHCFAMPTLGENFGHAIFESFSAGRPVIISDQSPWKELESKKIGYDLPLSSMTKFAEAIAAMAAMRQSEFDIWANSAWNFASNFRLDNGSLEQNKQLFEAAMQKVANAESNQ